VSFVTFVVKKSAAAGQRKTLTTKNTKSTNVKKRISPFVHFVVQSFFSYVGSPDAAVHPDVSGQGISLLRGFCQNELGAGLVFEAL
jgi:hypothetical protein